jgi:hypothetical protein
MNAQAVTPATLADHQIDQAEMTRSCARDLTDRIKTAVNDVSEMLWRAAHQGKAWKPLEYGSWKEYCTAEFRMSERRSFQLLDFVEIKHNIPQLNNCSVPEGSLRPLKAVEPGRRAEVYEAAVKIAGGAHPTAKQTKQAIVEALPPNPGTFAKIEPIPFQPENAKPSVAMEIVHQAEISIRRIPRDDVLLKESLIFLIESLQEQLEELTVAAATRNDAISAASAARKGSESAHGCTYLRCR